MSMESAEIHPDEIDIEDESLLTERRTLKGRLYFDSIESIEVNDQPYTEPLRLLNDWGGIHLVEITKNSVKLFIHWEGLSGKSEDFSVIHIYARSFFWDNDPFLFDPYREIMIKIPTKERIITQEHELMVQSALYRFNKQDWLKIAEIIDNLMSQGIYYPGFEDFVGINDILAKGEKDLGPVFLSILKHIKLTPPKDEEEAIWILLRKNIQEMQANPIPALEQFIANDYRLYDFYSATRHYIGDSHDIEEFIAIESYLSGHIEIDEFTMKEVEEEIIQAAKEWLAKHL